MNDFGSTNTRTSPNWKMRSPLARLRVEADVVAQARTSAALHAQAQPALFGRDAFLDDGRTNLASAFSVTCTPLAGAVFAGVWLQQQPFLSS